MRSNINPKSRQNDLVVQELPDEVLVYDLKKNKAFCLNHTAAFVWQHSVPEEKPGSIQAQFAEFLRR